jgi:glycerophosphoryl diester phosphodiesterase
MNANRLKRIAITVLIIGVLTISGSLILAKPAPQHSFFGNFDQYPIVFAHQGGDEVWPGDTLFAFEQAAKLGVDVLEMDAHITKDGILVLAHDETIDRTTDGTGAIEDMTLAELKTFDAAYDWSIDGGQTFPYRGQGLTIPTIEEVFQTFPDYPINIEIKKTDRISMAQPLCDLIRAYGMQNKVMVASFHDDALAEFRSTCPEVATSGSKGEVTAFVILNYIFLGGIYSPQEFALQVPESNSGILIVRPGFIRGAHARNLQVHIWTPNTREELQKFIDMGVDGIMTDRPDLLMEMLGR